jgi:hypothetical protein
MSALAATTPDAFSSSRSAWRYTREPWVTSEAAASSHSGEKPKAKIEPSSTMLPAPLRSASSWAPAASGSTVDPPFTAPTPSTRIRSRFFAVTSYRRERRTRRGSRTCAVSWTVPPTSAAAERTIRSGSEAR